MQRTSKIHDIDHNIGKYGLSDLGTPHGINKESKWGIYALGDRSIKLATFTVSKPYEFCSVGFMSDVDIRFNNFDPKDLEAVEE